MDIKMMLLETRQAGDRKRECWLLTIAAESSAENWSLRDARDRAELDVNEAFSFGNIQSPKTISNAITEGALAAHPAVRNEVARLVAIRDELWESFPDYLRKTLHGPSQTLVDLMRRQKQQHERHHVASSSAYLTYLKTCRFPDR
jgi:hypothetical protein